MKCVNHPVSPAVGQCSKCDTPLCGICANFLDDAIYCERCEKLKASERFVADQKAQLERPGTSDKLTQADREQFEREEQAERKSRSIQIGVIAVCALIIGVRLLFWFGSRESAAEQTVPGFSVPVTALPECLMVFQEIGRILAAGGQPPPSLRCPDSSVPPVISRDGSTVIASHPNPGAYGLSELFVSSDNPEPQLVN